MQDYSSEHIEPILRASLTTATYAYNVAKHDFWVVCSQQLSGEQKLVREAAAATAQRLAGEKMIEAMVRLNRFIANGTIPEDLKYLNAPRERAMGTSS